MTTPADQSTKPDRSLARIITSRPVDGTTARVIAQGPKGYESSKQILQVLSATPIPTRALPRHPTFADLRGRKRGKITVIGVAAEPTHTVRWVCRCVCGYYVTRTSKSIKNENNIQECCDRCRQVVYLRKRSHFDQTGQDKPITEFL